VGGKRVFRKACGSVFTSTNRDCVLRKRVYAHAKTTERRLERLAVPRSCAQIGTALEDQTGDGSPPRLTGRLHQEDAVRRVGQ